MISFAVTKIQELLPELKWSIFIICTRSLLTWFIKNICKSTHGKRLFSDPATYFAETPPVLVLIKSFFKSVGIHGRNAATHGSY